MSDGDGREPAGTQHDRLNKSFLQNHRLVSCCCVYGLVRFCWFWSGKHRILSQSSGSVATNTAGTRPCISFKTDPVDE